MLVKLVLTHNEKLGLGWGDILGANSASLTLNALTAADAGQYRVRVSNFAGVTDSQPATLTVVGEPTSRIALYPGITVEGVVGSASIRVRRRRFAALPS